VRGGREEGRRRARRIDGVGAGNYYCDYTFMRDREFRPQIQRKGETGLWKEEEKEEEEEDEDDRAKGESLVRGYNILAKRAQILLEKDGSRREREREREREARGTSATSRASTRFCEP